MQVICSNFLVERLQSAMVSFLSTRDVAWRHRPGHLGADAAAAAGGEVRPVVDAAPARDVAVVRHGRLLWTGKKGRSGGIDWVGWGPCGVGWVSGHVELVFLPKAQYSTGVFGRERQRLSAMTLTDAVNEYGRQHESRTTSNDSLCMHSLCMHSYHGW
jgi:hypothetical protein